MGISLASGLPTVADKCTGRGIRAVISATSAEAAMIGRDAFRDGGNAFDAALAAALAETVILPSKCGLAGDLVALCLQPSGPPRALLAIGPAPAGLGDLVSRDGTLPVTGGKAVGIPGAPAGYASLAQLGALGLTRAIEPAIDLAEKGFAWSAVNDRYVRRSRELLQRENPGGTAYLPGGRPIAVGSRVALPGLARVLEEFACRGAGLFMGPIGDALIDTVHSRGGVIMADDLANAQAIWEEPVSVTVGRHLVWATPSPTHGPSLLAALAEAGEAADAVALWKAVNNAIHDRQRNAGDAGGGGGTSVVAAADANGNSVVVVHSNSHPTFGSGIVLEPYALVLTNRAGRGFSSDPRHTNFPRPNHRPVTTLHAWALGPVDDRPSMMGATPGGENQMPWNAQVLRQLLSGAEPADAILTPRWAREADGSLEIEQGLPAGEHSALADSVAVRDVPLWSLPSGVQILSTGGRDGSQSLSVATDIRGVYGIAGL